MFTTNRFLLVCSSYWCIREQLSSPLIFSSFFLLYSTHHSFLNLAYPVFSLSLFSSTLILSLLFLLAPRLTNEIRQSRGVSGAKPELQWPGALAYSNILLREKERERAIPRVDSLMWPQTQNTLTELRRGALSCLDAGCLPWSPRRVVFEPKHSKTWALKYSLCCSILQVSVKLIFWNNQDCTASFHDHTLHKMWIEFYYTV